jgi:hypothetical protein
LFLNDKQPPSVFYTVDGFSMLSIKFLSKWFMLVVSLHTGIIS